jgi:site-specific DNA recombinase
VVKIFELYAQGNNSFQTVAVKMQAQSFAKTSRGKSITARTVELIIKNPFYIGMMLVNSQLYPHKYPALISEQLFNRVQGIISNHHKAPVQYAGKPILLRGLMTCMNCGSTVSGDIKKQKYVYYSCHNSKRVCTKKWVKEEALLDTLLRHFDDIKLTDEQINEIVGYIEADEIQQHEAARLAQHQLNQKLNLTQDRISKLIDMHIDGKIDAQTYHFKLEEYKREQQALILEIKSYDNGSKAELVAAREVLDLAQNAREIFMSSKLDEKQQLLGFFFSNLRLDREKFDVELREPFKNIAAIQDQTVWRS